MTRATAGRQDGEQGRGEGKGRGQGKRGGEPPQPDVQAVHCVPPGIQQMPEHHAHHHHHPIYNIDPNMGDLIPPRAFQPPRQAPPPPALSRGPAWNQHR